MATSLVDLSALLHGIPAGAWVAVSEQQQEVMAYGVDPQKVLEESRGKGEMQPLMVRVPEQKLAMFY